MPVLVINGHVSSETVIVKTLESKYRFIVDKL